VLKLAKGGKTGPKILIFDIETRPMLSYHWGSYKQFISPVQVVEYGQVLCWAAKWYGQTAVLFDRVKKTDKDDKRICESLWELCDEADIIVAHNGQAFDMSYMRTRWLKHGMVPPSPVKIVDTLKIVRKQFGFPDNKLETLVKYLGIGTKLSHTGFQMWLDCMAWKKAAWELMEQYNIQDVLVLEELYHQVRAWDTRAPNVALYYEDEQLRCICCGHRNFSDLVKDASTTVSVFDAKRCDNCGKVMRVGSRKDVKKVLRNVI